MKNKMMKLRTIGAIFIIVLLFNPIKTHAQQLITNGEMNLAAGDLHSTAPDSWILGNGSADVLSPGINNHFPGFPSYPLIANMNPSNCGGQALALAAGKTNTVFESVQQNISTVGGTSYKLAFEFAVAGLSNAATSYYLNSPGGVDFYLNGLLIASSSIHPVGSTWYIENIDFTAVNTGLVPFEVRVKLGTTGYDTYVLVDNVSITVNGGSVSLPPCLCGCKSGCTPPPLSSSTITNVCPISTVNLNALHIGTIPVGTSLVWSTDDDPSNGLSMSGNMEDGNSDGHVDDPLTVEVAGIYYAYYYYAVNDCYSPVSIGVDFTLKATPSITGVLSTCIGSKTQLTGSPTGGTWISGTPAVATVNTNNGRVTGVTDGTSVITYTDGNGCEATATVTINSAATITGTLSACVGTTTKLTGSAPTTGSTWTSATPGVATVNSSGKVTGVTGGTSVVTYTDGNGCEATATVTINSAATITGTLSACVGTTTKLTGSAPATGSGWTSATPAVATVSTSGLVTGVSGGTSVITYTDGNGCVTTETVTITTTTTWTGIVNSDWFNSLNWSNCVPSCSIDAVVPNVATSPTINFSLGIAAGGNGIATTKRITIKSNAVLTFGEDQSVLEICENMRHNGNLVMDDLAGNGRGKIVFNSSTTAQLYRRGASGSGDFHIVEMNNTFSTASLTLENNTGFQDMVFRTDGELILTNGKIITQTLNVDMRNPDINSISGQSVTSYIEGNLRRYVNNTGAYEFPVGHAAKGYQNIKVNFISNSIGYLTTRFDPWGGAVPNPGAQGGVDCGGTMNMTSLDNGYWTTTAGANPTSAVYDITLYNANYTNAATDWTVMKNSGAGWILDGTCQVSPVTAVHRNGQTGFSFQATAQSNVVLPIELLSFTGKAFIGHNKLYWITKTETNNDFFTIERSGDGMEFTGLGTVKGAGNSNTNLDYSFIDKNPLNGINYYRLKQTDFNGESAYSNIISLASNKDGGVTIYPNPSKGKLYFNLLESKDATYTVRYITLLGSSIHEKIEIYEGVSSYEVKEFNFLSAGIYFVQIINDQNEVIKYQKIVKE